MEREDSGRNGTGRQEDPFRSGMLQLQWPAGVVRLGVNWRRAIAWGDARCWLFVVDCRVVTGEGATLIGRGRSDGSSRKELVDRRASATTSLLRRQLDRRIEGGRRTRLRARHTLSTYLCKGATTTRVAERGSTTRATGTSLGWRELLSSRLGWLGCASQPR